MREIGHKLQNSMLGALAFGFSIVFGHFASWAITELFKGAVQDWIKGKLGAFTGIEEAEVLATATTVAVPALIFLFGIYAAVFITKYRTKTKISALVVPSQSHALKPSDSTENVMRKGQGVLDRSANAVAALAGLGWTVKPIQDAIQFELVGKPLPVMKESAGSLIPSFRLSVFWREQAGV